MSETIKAINTLTAIYKRKIDERDAEIAKLKFDISILAETIDGFSNGCDNRDDEIAKLKELMLRAVPIVSKVSGIEAHTLWKELREAAK